MDFERFAIFPPQSLPFLPLSLSARQLIMCSVALQIVLGVFFFLWPTLAFKEAMTHKVQWKKILRILSGMLFFLSIFQILLWGWFVINPAYAYDQLVKLMPYAREARLYPFLLTIRLYPWLIVIFFTLVVFIMAKILKNKLPPSPQLPLSSSESQPKTGKDFQKNGSKPQRKTGKDFQPKPKQNRKR
jgi:hypothetical protein